MSMVLWTCSEDKTFSVGEPHSGNWDISAFFSKPSRLYFGQCSTKPCTEIQSRYSCGLNTADSGMKVKRQELCELQWLACEIKLAIHEHPIPSGKVESDGHNEDIFISMDENSSY